jgi:hypothetical protein
LDEQREHHQAERELKDADDVVVAAHNLAGAVGPKAVAEPCRNAAIVPKIR